MSCEKTDLTSKLLIANKILNQNLDSIRTIEEWALKLDINTKLFSRMYLKHFGITCKKAMVHIRIQKACELLKYSNDLKCYEIALLIGLSDEYALYKYLKRHTGKSPSYFKKKRTEKTDIDNY